MDARPAARRAAPGPRTTFPSGQAVLRLHKRALRLTVQVVRADDTPIGKINLNVRLGKARGVRAR